MSLNTIIRQTSTQTIIESTTFTWQIPNYSLESELILSPKFALPSHEDHRIFLGLYPKPSLTVFDEDTLIYLWFPPKEPLLLQYKISILDSAGEKKLTKGILGCDSSKALF